MSTLATADLHKTLRHKDTAEITATLPPFPVIEAPELKAKPSSEQYAAVQEYRNVIVAKSLRCAINVVQLTVAFSKDRDAPDDIWFAIYVDAEGDALMTFWEQVGEAQEVWMQTQSETIKEFIYEHFATFVRHERYAV